LNQVNNFVSVLVAFIKSWQWAKEEIVIKWSFFVIKLSFIVFAVEHQT